MIKETTFKRRVVRSNNNDNLYSKMRKTLTLDELKEKYLDYRKATA
jgi:hypothetical protein